MIKIRILILALICVPVLNTGAQIITTFAGHGPWIGCGTGFFSGDGGPATLATFGQPISIAIDEIGNIYIADEENRRIRKIDTNGIINTIAGSNVHGYGGDDSLAGYAVFCDFGYIKIGTDSNLYIPDVCNNRVRKINIATDNIISTMAGNGVLSDGGDGNYAATTSVAYPFSIAFDNIGNKYISDAFDHIRKIDAAGIISRYAGTDSLGGYSGDGGPATNATFRRPLDMVHDLEGNLYITEGDNCVIRKIDPTGIISTYAGTNITGYLGDNGPATLASLYYPVGIAADGAGNIFFADCVNNAIRRIDHATNIITTIAGNGTFGLSGDGGMATDAQLAHPAGIAFDKYGNLYIADWCNNMIRKVTNAGVPLRVRGAESGERRGGEMRVFPNPAGKWVNVEGLPGSTGSILDMLGQVVQTFSFTNSIETINISSLATGVYIVEVLNKEGEKRRVKMVKE